jgi:hypothetical protein
MDGRAGFAPAFLEKRVGAGNGVYLEYWPVLEPQSCQVGLVMMSIHATEFRLLHLEQPCQGCSKLIIQVNLEELDAEVAAQFATLPPDPRKTLADPAMLHLIQLLHQEMQAPRPMSQLLINSIVQVLIIQLRS